MKIIMKKSILLNEDEKNRILNLHETAKNLYENKKPVSSIKETNTKKEDMKKVIKLTESDLEKIVKRVIEEQYMGVAFGGEQNGLRIKKMETKEQTVTGQQSTPPANLTPEQTTKIQKVDNLMNLVNQLPQMWANAFEGKYQRVPGATWFLSNGEPAFDRASQNPGYVKVGSNLQNYKKMENLINSGKAKGDDVYYILSSYVSPPLPNSKSQNWAFTNPEAIKKYGLTPPEKDDIYTSAKSAIDSMSQNLNASALLSMNKMGSESLSKGLPTTEGSYGKVPNIGTVLTNSVPKLVTTAKTANAKIKKPSTIFPPEQEKNIEYLFKYMG